ncbi:hypothetical protein BGX33_001423, partial [Mortierella sp. NVP41]
MIFNDIHGQNRGDSECQLMMERTLDLVLHNPRLLELEISYVEQRTRSYQPPPPPRRKPSFAVRVLQALHSSSSSSSSSSSTTTVSSLRSLKLCIQNREYLTDLCDIVDIVENCPETLQELSLEFHLVWLRTDYYFSPRVPELQPIRQRLPSISPRPALRRLSLQWFPRRSWNRGTEVVMDPEMALRPLLSCFPRLQDLTIPKITVDKVPILFKTLAMDCPDVKIINFGDNLIPEKDMYLFVKTVPNLAGITMRVSSDYLDRVLPTLLRQS